MPAYSADLLNKLLDDISKDRVSQVYLLTGERFLCQQAAGKICQALVASGGTLHPVDGERESMAALLHRLTSYSLFSGRQVFRVSDTRVFLSRKVAQSLWNRALQARSNEDHGRAAGYLRSMLASAGLDHEDRENEPGTIPAGQWRKLFGFAKPDGDLAWTASLLFEETDAQPSNSGNQSAGEDESELLERALEKGLPPSNILVLTAEDVDRRKRLYKYLEQHHVILDLAVESGTSKRAQTAQRKVLLDLIRSTLEQFGKTMEPAAAELLMERVGFSPVAAVMETEKLALYSASASRIIEDDLNAIVGRTRQEALYELTEALGKRQLARALAIADRLAENGIHPLAIVATLKNYTRNLLLFRALLEEEGAGSLAADSAGAFQNQVLPRLKQREQWKKELSGHPYALFMQCRTALSFRLSTLQRWMEMILQTDFRLKGSPVAPDILIHYLIFSMLDAGAH